MLLAMNRHGVSFFHRVFYACTNGLKRPGAPRKDFDENNVEMRENRIKCARGTKREKVTLYVVRICVTLRIQHIAPATRLSVTV